jgi:hypothetical protein
MEGYCSTGQSPQWAVVPVEEEEEEEKEEEEEEVVFDSFYLPLLRQSGPRLPFSPSF